MPLTPDEDPEVERAGFELLPYVHKDMVEAVAFNEYGDRFASSSADGKIKVHNRHKDGAWHLCDTWGAHSSEILEVSSPPSLIDYCCCNCRANLPFLATMAPAHPPPQSPRLYRHRRQVQALGRRSNPPTAQRSALQLALQPSRLANSVRESLALSLLLHQAQSRHAPHVSGAAGRARTAHGL